MIREFFLTLVQSAALQPHRAIESSRERDSMARRRYQKGQLWLDGKTWYGRWREDVLVGGVRKRIRRQEAIGSVKDYPTKRLAQRALDDRIAHVNKVSYRPRPTANGQVRRLRSELEGKSVESIRGFDGSQLSDPHSEAPCSVF